MGVRTARAVQAVPVRPWCRTKLGVGLIFLWWNCYKKKNRGEKGEKEIIAPIRPCPLMMAFKKNYKANAKDVEDQRMTNVNDGKKDWLFLCSYLFTMSLCQWRKNKSSFLFMFLLALCTQNTGFVGKSSYLYQRILRLGVQNAHNYVTWVCVLPLVCQSIRLSCR